MHPILPSLLSAVCKIHRVATCIQPTFASNCHLHSGVGSNTSTDPFFQEGTLMLPRTTMDMNDGIYICPLRGLCEGFFGVYPQSSIDGPSAE